MKFYEKMDPIKREVMILKAAAFNVSLEGMEDSRKRLKEEAKRLQSTKIDSVINEAIDQKNR